ncbi:DUF3306 domain-containing protein [Rhodobacteraceae bacterium]|nr:DUF3306 domain-containing protein [Paracoccaceae bacterium]
MSGDQSFWSRRRAGVEAEADAEQAAVEARLLAEEHAELEEKSDGEILAELNLPVPESLGLGDDFSVFMSKVVPDRLRRRALRVLWRSNPVLANVDMLVDYGEDFTDNAMCVENMQTTYQVGKGMLKHVQEMARQAEERENPKLPEPEVEEEDPEVLEDQTDVLVADASADTKVSEVEEEAETDVEVYTPPAPRRMSFRIEETA